MNKECVLRAQLTKVLYCQSLAPPTTTFSPVEDKSAFTSAKLSSSNVKRSVVVWKAMNSPKTARSAPGTNAVILFFSGEPGSPKMEPSAMEPSARLYDGSTTSNAIFDVEQRLVVMAECLVVTTGRVRRGVEKACADEATSTVMTIELVARIVPTTEVRARSLPFGPKRHIAAVFGADAVAVSPLLPCMEMMQQMQVTVPAGVGPGMPFQVNTPAGPMQVRARPT